MNKRELINRFIENLEKERLSLGYSQETMASKLDVSLSTYKRIINGETDKIDIYLAYKLYLLSGKLTYELLDIKDEKLRVKSKINNLSKSQLTFIEKIIDFEKDFVNNNKENSNEYISVFVPTGNMEDGMVYDSSNIVKVNIKDYKGKFKDEINAGIYITSNHLHPVYNKGDILLISFVSIRDGDTGIFINKNNGCAYIRKFHQTNPCLLEPINGIGKKFEIDQFNKKSMDEWIKFGKVISKMR